MLPTSEDEAEAGLKVGRTDVVNGKRESLFLSFFSTTRGEREEEGDKIKREPAVSNGVSDGKNKRAT